MNLLVKEPSPLSRDSEPALKRKSQLDPSGPPAKRDSLGSDSPSALHDWQMSPIASPKTIYTSPEPKSINAILREHPHQRLYVPPIVWTSDQPRLLDCQFARQELRQKGPRSSKARDSVKEVSRKDQQPCEEIIHAAAALQRISITSAKRHAIQRLLGAYDVFPLQ